MGQMGRSYRIWLSGRMISHTATFTRCSITKTHASTYKLVVEVCYDFVQSVLGSKVYWTVHNDVKCIDDRALRADVNTRNLSMLFPWSFSSSYQGVLLAHIYLIFISVKWVALGFDGLESIPYNVIMNNKFYFCFTSETSGEQICMITHISKSAEIQ